MSERLHNRLRNLYAIVAADENFVIGQGDQIPWKSRTDLEQFKNITYGHNLIMGSKTVKSLPHKLANRTIICLTHGSLMPKIDFVYDNVLDIIDHVKANPDKEFFVAGGAQIYEQFIDYCSTIYYTKVRTFVTGDNLTILGPKMQNALMSFCVYAKTCNIYDPLKDNVTIQFNILKHKL